MKISRYLIVGFLVAASAPLFAQQNSVSIGTNQINNKAVLWLVPNSSGQGLLLPVVSSSIRLNMGLLPVDRGMIVYDSNDNSVYVWTGAGWSGLAGGGTVSLVGTNGITITGNTISTDAVRPTTAATGDLSGTYAAPQIAPNAITNSKIANGAVDDAKIATVGLNKLVQGTATAGQVLKWSGVAWGPADDLATALTAGTGISIASNVISNTGLLTTSTAAGDVTGTFANLQIANGAITDIKLADNAVTTAKLANNSVTTSKIADGNVTTNKIADNSIGTAKVQDGNITSSKIADGAVTDAKIASGIAVNKLAPGTAGQVLTISGGQATWQAPPSGSVPTLANGQILIGNGSANSPATLSGDATLAAGALTISNNAVTTLKLANDAVTTTKILDASVTNAKLATGIDASKITTGTLPVAQVPNLDANKITSGTFATGQIPNLDASKIATGALPLARIVPSGTNGDVLTTVGGVPVWQAPVGGATTLDGLADVTATGATDAQILVKNGAGDFTNRSLSGDVTITNLGAASIANNAVTSAKILNDAVTTAKILDANVTNAKLAANAVDASKILDGTITGADLAGTIAISTTGNITAANFFGNGAGLTGVTATASGTASGDLSGTYPSPTVSRINGTALGGLPTGLLKNTTGTGVPTIAVPGTDYLTPTGSAAGLTSFPILNQNTTGSAASFTGALVGEVTGTQAATVIAANAVNSAKIADGTITGADLAGTIAITTTGNFATTGTLSSGATTVTGLTVSGASTSINGASLTWPGANASGTLTNDGAGNLTWVPAGGGGTVTSITRGTGLVAGAPITTSGTLDVNVGTGANQIVQLDASSRLPIIDGSQLTNFSAAQIPNLDAAKITTGAFPLSRITPSGTNGDVLTTVGGVPVWQAPVGGATTLDGLTDVTAAGATDAQILIKNGAGDFTNRSLSGDVSITNLGAATIANNAVTSAKILNDAVTTPKILDANVTNAKLAANAVDASKILDGTITGADLAGTLAITTTGNITAANFTGGGAGLTGLTATQIPNLDAAKITTGTLPVAVGGTGATSLSGLVIGTGTTALTSLPTGLNGQILTVNAGNPSWQNAPAPSGSAGGDLLGSTYPNPVIAAGAINSSKLATNAVATGNIADLAVTDAKINDVAPSKITAGGATNGQVLKFNGTNWVPQPDNVGGGGAPTLNPGQIIVGDGSTNSAATIGLDASLNSTNGNITVQGLRGRPIDPAVPATNSVYQFNGTQWTPVVLAGGGTVTSITAGTGLSGGTINSSGTIGINAGGVGTTELANNAVTAAKLASDGSVDANRAVTTNHVRDAAITDAKLASGITVSKLTPGTNGQILTTTGGVTSWQNNAALTNPMNTLGDLISGGAGGTPTRLGVGTNGQVLTVDAGVPSWQNATGATTLDALTDVTATGATDAQILIKNGAGDFTNRSLSGDVTITNLGAATIANNAVTSAKILNDAVTTPKILDANVTNAKLAANAVDASKILDGTITGADLAGTIAITTTGNITAANFTGSGAGLTGLTATQIPNLDAAKITTGSFPLARIVPSGTNGDVLTTVGGVPVWQAPVGGATTLDGLTDVTATGATDAQILIKNGAGDFTNRSLSGDVTITNLGAATIANNAVTSAKILNDAVTTPKILDANVTNAKLAANAVDASKILDGTITDADINLAGITTPGKVSGAAITSGNISTSGNFFTTGTLGASGTTTLGSLAGVGSRMVVANATGVLSTQAIPGLPTGSSGQTLRHDGTNFIATSNLFNNGTNVGIGTTSPSTLLTVASSSTDAEATIVTTNASSGARLILDAPASQFASIDFSAGGIPRFGTGLFGGDYYIDEDGLDRRFTVEGTTGFVAIGNIDPSERLDVDGNIQFSGALMPNSLPGTAGQVLTSAGAGLPPTWTTPGGGGNMLAANNLSELTNFATARANLGLGSMATVANPLTTTGDIIYATGTVPTRLAGAAGVLKSTGAAAPTWGAVNLATADVAGTLPIARGGTNVATVPTNGQLLIGNGTGYTLNTLTAGAGISITPGAGTITVAASGGASTLDALTDAAVAAPTAGQMLVYNGTSDFQNRSLSGDINAVSGTGAVTLTNSAGTRTNLGLGSLATLSAVGSTEITDASIVNVDIASVDAAKITTGTLAVARGGTNSLATPTNGGVSFGTGTAYAFTAAGTSGQLLQSNGAAAPSWVNAPVVREVADEFAATVSQTSFTLSQAPATNSRVKMYINGIRVSNTSYSVVGTTLTYNPANNGTYTLTAGDRIQFDYYY